jgi:hypothetical protein
VALAELLFNNNCFQLGNNASLLPFLSTVIDSPAPTKGTTVRFFSAFFSVAGIVTAALGGYQQLLLCCALYRLKVRMATPYTASKDMVL